MAYTITIGGNSLLQNYTDLSTGNNNGVSQRFTMAGAGTIGTVDFTLAKATTPDGNVTLDIFAATADDAPTGSSLGQATVAASSVGTTLGLITFTFGSPPSLSASTDYVLVVKRSVYTGGKIHTGGTIAGFGDTADYTDDGTTWLDLGLTHYAKVYVTEGGTPAVQRASTLPLLGVG